MKKFCVVYKVVAMGGKVLTEQPWRDYGHHPSSYMSACELAEKARFEVRQREYAHSMKYAFKVVPSEFVKKGKVVGK